MVLSQFLTFTVLSVISSTMPSALPSGISIQSPRRIMLFWTSCAPLTNPNMLSLKISMRTAAEAPRPVSRAAGDLPMRVAVIIMMPTNARAICRACTTPLRGWCLLLSLLLYMSRKVSSSELQIMMPIIIR